MPPRKTKPDVSQSDEGDNSPSVGYEKFDRAAILKSIGARSQIDDFDQLVETTQKIVIELFLNQASICLKIQKDYMERKRPLLLKDEFAILKTLTDLMTDTTAYDYGVDTNRAWEFLERQGYKISDGTEENAVE